MSWGRMLGAATASVAVVGCAFLAIGMSNAQTAPKAEPTPAVSATSSAPRPAYLPMSTAAGLAAATLTPTPTPGRTGSSSSAPSRPVVAATPTRPAPSTSSPAAAARPSVRPAAPKATVPKPRPAARTSAAPRAPAPPKGQALPLRYSTGTATRVITVTAHSNGSRTATLQAWTKAAGGGWRRYGTSVTAHVGSDGLSTHPSESRSATPIGSFTLTQAFGHHADPGTALPYIHTNSNDWWISQPGRLYNTHQRCSSGCSFTRGSPNEHLYYETPYYNYAVVIDYNTRNAPGGVRQGAGSAFFLHVTDGAATAGCVAISQSKLVSLMRWLTPSAHPRILIGVS